MSTSTPLLDALKSEKSIQRDKEAIQWNHPQYKDAARTSKKDDFKDKVAAAPGAASEAKQRGNLTAPPGRRGAKRAAATAAGAQKASARAGFTTQPKTGNISAAPPGANHPRPLRGRANPGEAASIKSNHRPPHQVKPHR